MVRREKFLDAAEAEIGTYGEAFGLSAVSKRAGFTRSAVYAMFTDRDELLDAVTARCAARLAHEVAAMVSTVEDPRERARSAIDIVARWIASNEQLATTIAPRMHRGSGSPITELIEQFLQEALVETDDSIRVAASWARAVIGATWATVLWSASAETMDHDKLVDQLTALVWDGMASAVNRGA